jgi:hypothetical protein
MHEEMMLIKAELERYKQITIYWEQKARSAEHQRRDILNQALDGHPEVRAFPFQKSLLKYFTSLGTYSESTILPYSIH